MMPEPDCQKQRHLIGAFIDGHLDARTSLDLEEHFSACSDCRDHIAFERSLRASLKRSVKSERCTDAFRARLREAALSACAGVTTSEAAPVSSAPPPSVSASRAQALAVIAGKAAPASVPSSASATAVVQTFGAADKIARRRRPRGLSWKTALPIASAAALALVWGAANRGPLHRAEAQRAFDDDLLDELVAEHAAPLPPERTDPREVDKFAQYVGVPVRPINLEQRAGAKFVGARVVPHHRARAAMLQYEIPEGQGVRRVSVLVYDPKRIRVHDDDLSPRAVGTAEVRIGRANGYSVAVTQRDGVGYALATDMDTEKSVHLASLVDE